MEKRYTLEDVVRERFEATKQRGKYLAYIVQELDAAGFKDYDDAVKKAIFKFGKGKSTSWGNLGAEDFMKHIPVPTKTDLDTVYKDIYTLKKRTRELEARLKAIEGRG